MKLVKQFIVGFLIGYFGTLVLVNFANAEEGCGVEKVEEATPKVFKDSDVVRKLKDGTTQRFDGDKFKIVPRTQIKRKPCPPTIVEKIVKVPHIVTKTIVKRYKVVQTKRLRNKLTLLLGNGPSDDLHVSRNTSNNSINIMSTDENLVGAQYSRDVLDFNDDLSLNIGATYLSNETVIIGIGLSW